MPERRYKGQRDHTVQAIITVLTEQGPLTRGEICQAINRDKSRSAAVVSRLNKNQKTVPKRIYIYDYVYEDELNGRCFPRARYTLGDKPDAKKPKPNHKAAVRRYREKQKLKVASVFDLGLTRKQREERRRETLGSGRTNRRRPLQETQDTADGVQHGEQP